MENERNKIGYMPVNKLFIKFATPAIIANVTNALYNIVDQIFIGWGMGYKGNAATSIAFPFFTICLSFGLMLGVGGAAGFNLNLGARREKVARSIIGTAISSLFIAGLIISIVFSFNISRALKFFGATDDIFNLATEYLSIAVLGTPFSIWSIGLNHLVRADGAAKYSMRAILFGAILNTILDPLFIFILKWGMKGAAIATVISQSLSGLILLLYFKDFKSVELRLSDLKPRLTDLKLIMSLGFGTLAFQLSNVFVQVVFNNELKKYGESSIYGSSIPIAIFGIVMKITVLFTSFNIGLINGSQPIISYNYGARNFARVRETAKLLLKSSFVVSVIFFIIFQLFPRQIIGIFGEGSDLYFEYGIRYMRIFLSLMFLNGVQYSGGTFFNTIGKPKIGATISLSKNVLFLIPLLMIYPKIFGLNGIAYAAPTADLLSFLLVVFFLKREFKKMPKENLTLTEESDIIE